MFYSTMLLLLLQLRLSLIEGRVESGLKGRYLRTREVKMRQKNGGDNQNSYSPGQSIENPKHNRSQTHKVAFCRRNAESSINVDNRTRYSPG